MSSSGPTEPPDEVRISVDEALELPAALEDSCDVLIEIDHVSVQAQIAHQIRLLSAGLGFDQAGPHVS